MTIHGDAGSRASSSRTGRWLAIGGLLLLVILLAAGILPRLERNRRLVAEEGAANAMPTVSVTAVKLGEADLSLTLPATLMGLHEVGLFARTNGYVTSFTGDIGMRVRAGESLAKIETPELDQELMVAQATLEQVLATNELTRTSLDRWRSLSDAGVATKQEFDERQAAFNASRASVNAARSNLERLTALKRFANVIAPFSGVITSRGLDIGALVSSATGANAAARPLFTIAQVDTIRALTNVPQDAAPSIRVGQAVDVIVQELGSTPFRGEVARTAAAIDPVTRTLLTTVRIVNRDGRLMPGMYAQVKLTTPRPRASLVIPANTLIIRGDGPQVAVVRNGRVQMVKITLGRDFGTSIEALTGVVEGDLLVINPADDVTDGAAVRVLTPRDDKKSGDGK